MTRTKKFSALVAAVVVAFMSIYATNLTFNSTNLTSNLVTVTLNMQSGAQIPVSIAPGQSVPTQISGDQVVGLWLYGAYDPAGVNAIIPCPTGGHVAEVWQMSGATPVGCTTEPDSQTMS